MSSFVQWSNSGRKWSSVAVATAAAALLCGRFASAVGDGTCTTAADCFLNGDCSSTSGTCVCDPAWRGSANCDVMSFDLLDKTSMPGYYNSTASSWGGFPIEAGGSDGGYWLFHAQMANGCGLSTWTSNSIVARSKSTTGRVEGPYEFDREVLPHFAHNPTIRRAPDGTYVVYFIGSWSTEAQKCVYDIDGDTVDRPSSAVPTDGAEYEFGGEDTCVANTTYDGPHKVRVGKDYATVALPLNATIEDCAASCCNDSKCVRQLACFVVGVSARLFLLRTFCGE